MFVGYRFAYSISEQPVQGVATAHTPQLPMTIQLQYDGKSVAANPQESVLNALLRVGIQVPYSCKGGSCRSCLMQCVEGEVPAKAQRGLPSSLAQLKYLLPCQCLPTGDMQLSKPQPDHLITECMLCEVTGHDRDELQLIFEPSATLRYRTGQTLRWVTQAGPEPEMVITSDPDKDILIQAQLRLDAPGQWPPGLGPDADFGQMFEVRGPYDASPLEPLPAPPTDAPLWAELDHGAKVRAVLEAFYPKVYAHPTLAPFFKGVTMRHAIDKQYAFLRLRMTGETVDFVESPRNTHHWMIITHDIFDLRQQLMKDTQRELGLTEAQMQRWTRLEEHYRPDMVKNKAWPRVEKGVEIHNEGFAREILLEGSLCDHCGGEVNTGTEVLYHLRTGAISCPACAATR